MVDTAESRDGAKPDAPALHIAYDADADRTKDAGSEPGVEASAAAAASFVLSASAS